MNKRNVVLLIFLLIGSISGYAQKRLIFQNDQLDESVEIKEGDYVKFRYKGYLNQEAEVESYVLEVTDAAVTFNPGGKKSEFRDDRTILLSDVTGFRKMYKLRPILAPITSLGVGIGIYYAIGTNDQFNNTEQLLYSLGATLGTSLLIKWVFKTDIKLKMSDGWYIRVVGGPY
ncbi:MULTISPECIES: hypothetical protein [Reichenbachiella]|uniref:Uncharacterized protein n=1 Tax=Reichenbachiella agariperforans TaxID=156994 RepID=A0A1M6R9N7_REIAG|nr:MULTISPECIES: hypothetical protein [Reichenbachiella]MBU2912867.1 hypothetical protein [Reichenbachiella agariperforans]RJE70625.1 hypothetical protein BGP76_11100 [Reichenbachiella sp. MSK19-1]SHK29193.1 hypothetical protein SAMN04488028_10489 [Reichenbachiella agariperforans]